MVKLKLGHRRIQGRQGRLRFDGDMLIIALIGQHSTVDGEHLVVEIKHLVVPVNHAECPLDSELSLGSTA
jgi:hypothetical protein